MLFSLLADKATWYPIKFDTALNIARSVSIWLTLALAIAFAVCVFLLKGEKRAKFLKISLISVICYAAAVGVILLTLTFVEDKIVTILFVPFIILIAAIAAGALAIVFKRCKSVYIISGCAVGAALIALFVCMGVHFASGYTLEVNGVSKEDVNQIGLYICAIIFMAAIIAVAFIFDKHKNGFDTKSISYAAICIAMSFALSYLRLVKMPQGGSITFASLVPLMLYSYMFGTKKGVFAGVIYGILQAFQDPYILHPAQFVLDYPAAFAGIGLAGIFADFKPLNKLPQVQFAIGGVIAGVCRFIMHYLSGIFAFGSYAPEGQPAWLYSLIYQSGYVLPDIAIAIVVGAVLLCSPSLVSILRKAGAEKTKKDAPAQTVEGELSEVAVAAESASASGELQNIDNNGESQN